MAHRLLARGSMNVRKKITDLQQQQFKYLLILDFEATCEKNGTLKPHEIIEFPCIALSTNDWEIKDVFHRYIKPRINPILTPFCTDLTGIMQETIDEQPQFPQVLAKFEQWLKERGFVDTENTSAFVTCGDWDLRVMLPNQCDLEGLTVPKYFEKWIDLKRSYCDATSYYPRSLKDMLLRSDIPLQGRLHSGLCDAQNMTRIVTLLKQRHNAIFKITSSTRIKYYSNEYSTRTNEFANMNF